MLSASNKRSSLLSGNTAVWKFKLKNCFLYLTSPVFRRAVSRYLSCFCDSRKVWTRLLDISARILVIHISELNANPI